MNGAFKPSVTFLLLATSFLLTLEGEKVFAADSGQLVHFNKSASFDSEKSLADSKFMFPRPIPELEDDCVPRHSVIPTQELTAIEESPSQVNPETQEIHYDHEQGKSYLRVKYFDCGEYLGSETLKYFPHQEEQTWTHSDATKESKCLQRTYFVDDKGENQTVDTQTLNKKYERFIYKRKTPPQINFYESTAITAVLYAYKRPDGTNYVPDSEETGAITSQLKKVFKGYSHDLKRHFSYPVYDLLMRGDDDVRDISLKQRFTDLKKVFRHTSDLEGNKTSVYFVGLDGKKILVPYKSEDLLCLGKVETKHDLLKSSTVVRTPFLKNGATEFREKSYTHSSSPIKGKWIFDDKALTATPVYQISFKDDQGNQYNFEKAYNEKKVSYKAKGPVDTFIHKTEKIGKQQFKCLKTLERTETYERPDGMLHSVKQQYSIKHTPEKKYKHDKSFSCPIVTYSATDKAGRVIWTKTEPLLDVRLPHRTEALNKWQHDDKKRQSLQKQNVVFTDPDGKKVIVKETLSSPKAYQKVKVVYQNDIKKESKKSSEEERFGDPADPKKDHGVVYRSVEKIPQRVKETIFKRPDDSKYTVVGAVCSEDEKKHNVVSIERREKDKGAWGYYSWHDQGKKGFFSGWHKEYINVYAFFTLEERMVVKRADGSIEEKPWTLKVSPESCQHLARLCYDRSFGWGFDGPWAEYRWPWDPAGYWHNKGHYLSQAQRCDAPHLKVQTFQPGNKGTSRQHDAIKAYIKRAHHSSDWQVQ